MSTDVAPSTKVWIDGDRIHVSTAYEYKDICKTIPGYRWNQAGKTWHYPATLEVAGAIVAAFSDGIRATQPFIDLAGRARDAAEARVHKAATDLPDVEGEVLPSWLHQKQLHHFAGAADASMLGVGMGGGKSKSAIDLIERPDWDAKVVLIICPNNVVKVWPKEFAGDPYVIPAKPGHQHREWNVVTGLRRNRNGRLVSGSLTERTKVFKAAIANATTEHPVAIVVNYEAAPQGALGQFLLSVDWDVVILDESHRIKSPGGVQSKFCENMRRHARKRLCLTGTAMPHNPLDIYAQFRFLDPGIFGTSYARFRNRYAVMGGYMGKQVLGMNTDMADELAEKMAMLAYIITNEELDEALGLPEAVWLPTREITLSTATKQAYDGMANDLIAKFEEGTVSVNNALTQLLRLQQITSGHLPVEIPCAACDGIGCDKCSGVGSQIDLVEVGTEKRDNFKDWLEDLPQEEPVVVACRFTHDLDSVRHAAEATGRRYGELSGRDNSGLTEQATMATNIDVLGVQIQAGGVGIDLTRARYAANYSVGFNNGEFRQWLKRVHRPGQKRTTYYQNFACLGTVDVAVFRALQLREDVVQAVMSDAKNTLFD